MVGEVGVLFFFSPFLPLSAFLFFFFFFFFFFPTRDFVKTSKGCAHFQHAYIIHSFEI